MAKGSSTKLLKASWTKDQLTLAAEIGNSSVTAAEKVQQLFSMLPDPLLSTPDASELLGVGQQDVQSALSELWKQGILDRSEETLRPFDPEGVTLFRLSNVATTRLRLIALEVDLGDKSSRLQFTCDGRLIRSISMVDRLDAVAGTGQQREEIRAHVEEIARGIEANTQIPNSILLVLRSAQVQVEEVPGGEPPPHSFVIIRPLSEGWTDITVPSDPQAMAQRVRLVEIDFPYRHAAFDAEKPTILVDGQQRTAALALVDVDKVPSFFLSVNAVVADDEDAKRVFQVANSTVKISTQFSRALLASMGDAPGYLLDERTKALAAKTLALTEATSPFKGRVQYPGSKASDQN